MRTRSGGRRGAALLVCVAAGVSFGLVARAAEGEGAESTASPVERSLAKIETALTACTETNDSNMGRRTCTSTALDAADKLLNGLYGKLVDQMKASSDRDDKERLRRLVASERAWVAYRDAECNLQGASMLGGSGEPLMILDCHYSLTRERAKRLEDPFSLK